MKAYVVNLERSTDRREHIEQQLARTGLQYEMISGVDGSGINLTDDRLVDPGFVTKSWFRPGVAGCALSHLKVYQKAIADRAELALVLEDDITLPEDLVQLTEAISAQMSGAEVVLLNFHTEERCLLSTRNTVPLPASRTLAWPIDCDQLTSAGAYLVTREACERLERQILPVRVRADEWGFFRRAGFLDRVRCVVPLPVRKDLHFQSTMGYHSNKSLHARLQKLAGYRIPGLYQALAYRRVLIGRRWSRVTFVPAEAPGAPESGCTQQTAP